MPTWARLTACFLFLVVLGATITFADPSDDLPARLPIQGHHMATSAPPSQGGPVHPGPTVASETQHWQGTTMHQWTPVHLGPDGAHGPQATVPETWYLSERMGRVHGVPEDVRLMSPEMPERNAGDLASAVLAGGDPIAAASDRIAVREATWYAPAVWHEDRLVTHDAQVELFLAPGIFAAADVNVRLVSVGTDGARNYICAATAPLTLPHLRNAPLVVDLHTAGHTIAAGHGLALSITFDGPVVLAGIHTGPDSPSALVGLKTRVRDADGDGVGDTLERRIGTDPGLRDTDGDGVQDGDEMAHGSDPNDPHSIPARYRNDPDGDGIQDHEEVMRGTDPYMRDTDSDGFSDGYETQIGTDPLDPQDVPLDTDQDGLDDDAERRLATDHRRPDTDRNGIPDPYEDADRDGLTNLDEIQRGTNPLLADTDGDGVGDGTEVDQGHDPLTAAAKRFTAASMPVALGSVALLGVAVAGMGSVLLRRSRPDTKG